MTGQKDDKHKPDYTLLPMSTLSGAARVSFYGAYEKVRSSGQVGYGRDNWKEVEDGEARYLAACLRHLVDHIEGRQEDEESGLPAIDHALIDLMFAIWHMRQE